MHDLRVLGRLTRLILLRLLIAGRLRRQTIGVELMRLLSLRWDVQVGIGRVHLLEG